jgi:L-ascorbate metabolism protein UlaG (beta-lactamase superfamily)
MATSTRRTAVTVRLIGGPTVLLEVGGLRLLTDPSFDRPGPFASGSRTLPPAVSAEEIGALDAVLLSHDQHGDNLDPAGRVLLGRVPLVLTTSDGAARLGGTARALLPWYHLSLDRADGGALRITGVPAQHLCGMVGEKYGPDGTTYLTCPVTGFVLSGVDVPTVYVSGDNASLDVVREVSRRCGPIDAAVLFAGAARTELVDGYLTLTAEAAAQAAEILGPAMVIPAHVDGWGHDTENLDDIRAAFARYGIADRLCVLAAGEFTSL